jgi:nitrogen-specific signal transduction histidine kinase
VKTALLLTSDEALRARLSRALHGVSVFFAPTDAEALEILSLVDLDVVFRDGALGGDLPGFVARVREAHTPACVVAIGSDEGEALAADFSLPASFASRDLTHALRPVEERLRLLREIGTLRAQLVSATATGTAPTIGRDAPALPRILKEFSRLFATGFDLPRALEMFLDGVGELVRPARSALLLPDEADRSYRVAAHRGLAPQIARSVRLSAATGLGHWLAAQGRPARLADLTDPDVARELALLQGAVAVPLLAQGELVGVLALGQPVVGGGYSRDETETLFDLATHFATAIRDITLHHRLEREKEFSERILAHMSSGVVTIGRNHRISAYNRRAEEILGIPAAQALRQDLRVLPSPLGDMLFETLSRGRTLPRAEIQLALRRLWLEVSAYPVHGDEPAPLGAVLVFEDVTAQKELAAQKRKADEAQLLTRVVARIADEIKNPLVSINTFVELLDERYEDQDFRRTFSSVVRRDARRLVQVIEKLTGLVSEGELDFTIVDAHALVADVISAIDSSDEGVGKRVEVVDASRESTPLPVKIDVRQTRKAISYLIGFLAHNTPGEQASISVSAGLHGQPEAGEQVWILVGSRSASVGADKLQRLFDPVQMVQESLIDVGPAVSQRLLEAQGGRLRLRQGRHELSFLIVLPPEAR